MFYNLAKYKTINKFLVFLISICIFDSKKRRKLRSEIKSIYYNQKKSQIMSLIQEKYADAYCIFSRFGIGDIFFIASLLKEFKKQHHKRIIYFTEKKSLINYLQSFPSIDEVVYDKELDILQEETTLQKKLEPGTLNKLFFPYRGSLKTFTFADNYNNMLGLPLDAERELPVISENNCKMAEQEFINLQISPSKTILIIPDATMFDYRTIPVSFWEELAKRLNEQGYEVVFNTKLKQFKKIKNVKHTFLPIMDFIALAKQVKYIISFRSGISDLLAGMQIYNMSVLYSPNLEVIWADATKMFELHKHHEKNSDYEMENLFNIHSLNKTFKTNEINEIFYNYNNSKTIDNIIENINK